MKRSFSILAFVIASTGIASADNLKLSPLGAPVAAPADFDVVETLKLEGHAVGILREHTKPPKVASRTQMSFEVKGGKFQLYATSVGYSFAISKLKGDRHALLSWVDTVTDDDAGTSHVDVCAYDKTGAVSCGSVDIECPETGCQAPEIMKSALWVHAKGGRKRFPITE